MRHFARALIVFASMLGVTVSAAAQSADGIAVLLTQV